MSIDATEIRRRLAASSHRASPLMPPAATGSPADIAPALARAASSAPDPCRGLFDPGLPDPGLPNPTLPNPTLPDPSPPDPSRPDPAPPNTSPSDPTPALPTRPTPEPSARFPQALVPASVLVAIVLSPQPGVLLTRRHAQLRRHAGQVSFPGGRNDPGDRDAEAAALRESWEEIGLPAQAVELVGRLPDQPTGTGFLITPVLGLVDTLPELRASPDEVDTIFQLPLSVLLDPCAPLRRRQMLGGRMREVWVWPHPEHDVMGATASILMQLARRLRAPQ